MRKTIRSASASASFRNADMQLRTQTDDAVALSLMSFECVTADEAWPRLPRILSCQWGGIKRQDMAWTPCHLPNHHASPWIFHISHTAFMCVCMCGVLCLAALLVRWTYFSFSCPFQQIHASRTAIWMCICQLQRQKRPAAASDATKTITINKAGGMTNKTTKLKKYKLKKYLKGILRAWFL